jgi:hypothetical protein
MGHDQPFSLSKFSNVAKKKLNGKKKKVFFLGFLAAKFLQIFLLEILPDFTIGFQECSQNCERILNYFSFSCPGYSQIWLNFIMNDHQIQLHQV